MFNCLLSVYFIPTCYSLYSPRSDSHSGEPDKEPINRNPTTTTKTTAQRSPLRISSATSGKRLEDSTEHEEADAEIRLSPSLSVLELRRQTSASNQNAISGVIHERRRREDRGYVQKLRKGILQRRVQRRRLRVHTTQFGDKFG